MIAIEHPDVTDGEACWELATASKVLDVNSRYAYLLWCRDFSATSVVARRDGVVVGFVTGYRRPDRPDVLVVWQVAVDGSTRGEGIAGRMLDELVASAPAVGTVETTVTPDNEASIALFTSFAKRHAAGHDVTELFGTELLGPGHAPEMLHSIGPIDRGMMLK